MATYTISKCKRSGKLKYVEPDVYKFTSKDEEFVIDKPSKKIVLDSTNMLLEVSGEWVRLSVLNIPESVQAGILPKFWNAAVTETIIHGYNSKNDRLVVAFFEEDGEMIIGSSKSVFKCTDEDLTMAIVQRNSPSTSSFDIVWCYAVKHLIYETTFEKKNLDDAMKFCGEITDNVFDIGADPHDWPAFLKMQKMQGGDANDWVGCFSALTDESEEDNSDFTVSSESEESEEESDDEEIVDGSDTDVSECSWEGSDSEDERPVKKTKRA